MFRWSLLEPIKNGPQDNAKSKKCTFARLALHIMKNQPFRQKSNSYMIHCSGKKNNVSNNFEYQKAAFKHEMFNHEYSINWQADYDTLSAFGMIDYKSTATLDDYLIS